jgi:hypothetical protein
MLEDGRKEGRKEGRKKERKEERKEGRTERKEDSKDFPLSTLSYNSQPGVSHNYTDSDRGYGNC